MESENQITYMSALRDFLTIFFKYKKMILVVFLVIAATGVGITLTIPKIYEARASILVKVGQEFMYRPETPGRAERVMTQEQAMNNEIKILTNVDLIKKVIEVVGIKNLFPDWEVPATPDGKVIDIAAETFAKNLTAYPVLKSSVIEVAYKHENPVVAAQAVNALIEHFKDKHIDVYSDPKSSFLEEQTGSFSERLKKAEDKLQSFKQSHQVYSLDEQRNSLWQQRVSFDTNLRDTLTQIRQVEERMAIVRGHNWQPEGTPESRTRLAALQIKERELLEKYTENSRMVQSVRNEMTAVRESDKKLMEEARRIELSKLQGELAVLQAKADGLRRQVGQISGELQVLDSREKEFTNLRREMGAQETQYKTYLNKLEEARILDDLNKKKMTNVSVLQTASVPISPVKSKKQQYMLASIILALGAALGLAFVREKIPQHMTTPLAAEKHLGLPVIAAIALKK